MSKILRTEKLEKQMQDKAKYEKEQAIMKAICDNSKIDIPEGMIELEVDNMIKDMEQRMSYQGLKLEQYLKMLNKTEAEFRKESEPQAIEAIKSRLVLEAIAAKEDIKATEKEVTEKIKEMAKNYGRNEEDLLKNENVKKYIEEGIVNEKTIDLLIENVKETKKAKAEKKNETKSEKKEKKEKAEKKSTK